MEIYVYCPSSLVTVEYLGWPESSNNYFPIYNYKYTI